jgi:FkbM family methyltransferase
MRFLGKLRQLLTLPLSQWPEFARGWTERGRSGVVPCVPAGARRALRVPLREYYDAYAFFTDSAQGRREIAFFLSKLRPGDVVYDIGAFRGAYGAATKVALGDAVSVHLFEPLTDNLQRIAAIAALNEFRQFYLVNKAVGSQHPIAGVVNPEDGMLRSSCDASVELPSISVDAYSAETGTLPTVLKIDVEGFEREVIEGAHECLVRHGPRIWLELHPENLVARGLRWGGIVDHLKSLGYAVQIFPDYQLPMRERGFHVWCER